MVCKYKQLATQLQSDISRGAFVDKLPTELELVTAHGVSRQTVRQALDRLVQLGLIEKRQGSGSHILEKARHIGNDRVAVVTSYINDYIFPSVLQDIQLVLTQRNYSTLLFSTQNQVSKEREVLQSILHQPVGGLIIEGSKTALPNPNLDLYEKLNLAGIPFVFLHGSYAALSDSVCVTDDNFGGSYLLTRHLITRGHTKIAGIFKSDDIQGHQRYLGYLSAMRDAGLPLPDDRVLWYSTEDRHYLLDYGHNDLLERFLQFHLRDCTAIVCYNDEMADRLIRLLLHSGRKVPNDIAVVSFDNSYYSDLCPVRITSLAHEAHRLGGLAASLLLDKIDDKPCRSQSIIWKLMRKESG